MSTGVASGTKLLLRANQARTDPAATTPFHLWQLADREANGVRTARTILYRHAMLHAGYLVEKKTGKPFRVCPDCSEPLA